jgi:hypothetical protein
MPPSIFQLYRGGQLLVEETDHVIRYNWRIIESGVKHQYNWSPWYLIKIVSDLRQFIGFHRALRFLPPITGRHDIKIYYMYTENIVRGIRALSWN